MNEARKRIILNKVKQAAMSESDKRMLTKVLPVAAGSTALGAGAGYLVKEKLKKAKTSLNPQTQYRLAKALSIALPILAGGATVATLYKNKRIREALEGEG